MAKKSTDKVNVDELAKAFDISPWEDLDEMNSDYYFEASGADAARNEILESGGTEDEADEAASKAEQEVRDDLFHNWHNCMTGAIEDLFDKHGLTLVQARKNEKYPFEYKIVPTKSWEEAALKIIDTINGVGMFEYANLKEFLDAGPYTAREAVLSHWHHIASYPEVYGDTSAQRRYERCMK